MAALNLQNAGTAGAAPGLAAAAAGGDSFPMVGIDQVFHFKNLNAAVRNVTFVVQNKCNFGTLHANLVVPVPNATERFVSGLDPRIYADANGRVQLTYDAVTDLTVGSHA